MTAVASSADRVFAFGPFRLLPGRQLLLEGDKPVHVGSRARDILMALVERSGEVVGKEELLARVWRNTTVDEGNLKVHVAALRRALGDGKAGNRYIINVPGRGYSFVGDVSLLGEPEALVAHAVPVQAPSPSDLPAPLTRMIGRDDIVAMIAGQMANHRLVTIVGPGGIGKTTVGLAVAERLVGAFADRARLIDLASIADPQLVPTALAASLGVAVRSDNPIPGLTAFLRDKHILLVLDSCEHVIEAVATLVAGLLKGTRRVHVLTTSREPLRTEGERLQRLAPLATPPEQPGLTAQEALAYPAVQLFVERTAEKVDGFALTDADAPVIADICRRLDGLALAIELAAGRVDTFGVGGLAARLDDRFRLLSRGLRSAAARHQALSATLDWSYELLSEAERIILGRLAIFAGSFTAESAIAVASGPGFDPIDVADHLENLIAKSLVVADFAASAPRHRLLDSTRAYAAGKLHASGERALIARRHAGHYLELMEHAEAEWETRPASDWVEEHRHLTDNVRSALNWAFSPEGDASIAVALTLATVPLWFQLSLMSECCERVGRALSLPQAAEVGDTEMRLSSALAWSLMQTKGSVPETRAAWSRVLALAERSGSVDYQLRALWGLWAGLLNGGQLRAALELAERFSTLATLHSDLTDTLVGDRMVGYILHLMGDQARARFHIERMLSQYVMPVVGAKIVRFIFDQRVTARCFLARILWLQGFPDQAIGHADAVVADASQGGDMLSLCQALVQAACPLALFAGDLDKLERSVTMLLDYSLEHGLDFWHSWGRCFKGVLLVRRGETAAGLPFLNAALRELRDKEYGVYYIVILGELAEALGRAGFVGEGLAAIDQALDRSRRNEELWCIAELLRVKGEILLRDGSPGATEAAEAALLESLNWSRDQQVPSWELRTANGLARHYLKRDDAARAQQILRPIHARFSEGFTTADLIEAGRLLDEAAR